MVNPLKKLSSALGRIGVGIRNRYDAAGHGRRMRGWNPSSAGPNKTLAGLQKLRNRARDASRNDWSGESANQKWTTSLIGIGIVPRLNKDVPEARKKQLVKMWKRWVELADADGVLNFYGLQTLAVRSWLDAGEVFVRKRVRRLDGSMEIPLQVQLIEAEFVPLFDATTWPGMVTGNRIRSGIELDRRGQRVAYWMYREHPGDNFSGTVDVGQLLRIPASEVLHIFEPKRPGQLRGVSALAPVLARLRNIADFDDAVLERQKLANLFVAFITRGVGSDANVDPLTNMPIETDGENPLAALEPGLLQELDYGQDIKFANPPEAGTMFGEYMRVQHMGTAAASGLPYELFSGDIVNVSDRTLRVLINEFRRFAEQRQWQVVIPMFCQPIRQWWTDTAFMAGVVSQDEVEDVALVEWATHGWAHIHPVQDPQGKQMEVNAGFRSRSSVISERGDDPVDVDEERAADQQREKALGIQTAPPAAAPGDPGVDPTEEQPTNPARKQK